jgi:hypothetical protein
MSNLCINCGKPLDTGFRCSNCDYIQSVPTDREVVDKAVDKATIVFGKTLELLGQADCEGCREKDKTIALLSNSAKFRRVEGLQFLLESKDNEIASLQNQLTELQNVAKSASQISEKQMHEIGELRQQLKEKNEEAGVKCYKAGWDDAMKAQGKRGKVFSLQEIREICELNTPWVKDIAFAIHKAVYGEGEE